jgi:hypothetical protein
MTENGPTPRDRFTRKADKTPWMATRPGSEPPDSLASDAVVVAFAITVLLVIFVFASLAPA